MFSTSKKFFKLSVVNTMKRRPFRGAVEYGENVNDIREEIILRTLSLL